MKRRSKSHTDTTPRNSPPLPRFVLRVGVTGHRPNRLASDAAAHVETQFVALWARIQSLMTSLNRDGYAPAPPELRIVSALAEGADRIAAHTALTAGAGLDAILPFSANEYSADFSTADSREEFFALLSRATATMVLDGKRDSEATAYESAGLTILRQCDFLIAAWDGLPAAGRGGTGQIVDQAMVRHVPTIWIDTSQMADPVILLTDTQGNRVKHPLAQLDSLLAARLRLPYGDPTATGDGAHDYFKERQPFLNSDLVFSVFRALVTNGRLTLPSYRAPLFESLALRRWQADLSLVSDLSTNVVQYGDRIFPHFAWADGLSSHYAGMYRSVYVLNYLLAGSAVLVAAAFTLIGLSAAMIELVITLVIVGLTRYAHRRRWHMRWLEYRELAERLRHLRFLGPVGGLSSAPRRAAHTALNHTRWVEWLLGAVVREAGLVSATADSAYRSAMQQWLATEIRGQADYHEQNAKLNHAFDHRLHRLSLGLFLLTTLVCVARLITGDGWHQVFILLAATLPAFGAAIVGIHNQGEFARIGARSAAMARELTALRTLLLGLPPSPKLDELQRIAEQAAEVMNAETVDWRFVLNFRPLGLPT